MAVGKLADKVVVVVTVVVVVVAATHLPEASINPSLLEHVLQATPPSLYPNEYVPAGHPETQSAPLATNPCPQLLHTLLGSTPNAT